MWAPAAATCWPVHPFPMLSRKLFFAITGGALAAPAISWGAPTLPDVPVALDHILLGCSDLDKGIAFVQDRTGVRAAFGGVHPGRGTRNALLSLGEKHYLEIIAPDPAQSGAPDIYGLQKLIEPRVVTWAVHTDAIESAARRAVAAGFAIDGPTAGSRARPDGVWLRWKAFRLKNIEGSLLPFFIEWDAKTTHPSVDAPSGCTLQKFVAQTTHPSGLQESFRKLEIPVQVELGKREQLVAQISGSAGTALLVTS